MKISGLSLFYFLLLAQIGFAQEINNTFAKKRVLIGAPIRQKPAILKEFLLSLEQLYSNNFQMHFIFVDDNNNPESVQILSEFALKHADNCIIASTDKIEDNYICNEQTHYWNDSIIWKVAFFKDCIIEYALSQDFDYLFLIDSDLVLYPETIEHLITLNKDIVSEIFWTSWQPDTCKLPQVWYYDEYKQYIINPGEQLSDYDIATRQQEFLQRMETPGTYEIGGLGACTLLSKKALAKGARFKKIKNLTFWGEDRHFCIRAAALDLEMFVDTFYPAYHIYRESYLDGVNTFKENCKKGIYQI